jgi:hypothetical protein
VTHAAIGSRSPREAPPRDTVYGDFSYIVFRCRRDGGRNAPSQRLSPSSSRGSLSQPPANARYSEMRWLRASRRAPSSSRSRLRTESTNESTSSWSLEPAAYAVRCCRCSRRLLGRSKLGIIRSSSTFVTRHDFQPTPSFHSSACSPNASHS